MISVHGLPSGHYGLRSNYSLLISSQRFSRRGYRKKKKTDSEEDAGTVPPATELEGQDKTIPATEEVTATVEAEQPSPPKDEGRQRKRLKKRIDGQKLYEGFFRTEFYIPRVNKYVARPSGFVLNRKEAPVAADCLYLDMPSGLRLSEDDIDVEAWNVYPADDDLPRKLMSLGRSILDDRGCLIILHAGSLRSTQQIAHALDAFSTYWIPVASFDVISDVPQFESLQNMKVYVSKVEVFCKAWATFPVPKFDQPPFDNENSGRDAAIINNYNTTIPTKLDDGGRRKCTGFVQTLLENFTSQGDIVIDYAGGWGATIQAAFNCSRSCIAADLRKEAFDSLRQCVVKIEEAEQTAAILDAGPSTQPVTDQTRGKKPLGEDDDLGDNVLETNPGYKLPSYAENMASKLAAMPETQENITSGSSRLKRRFMPFVDDEAQEEEVSPIVSLSSEDDF
ncbi:hypothetical protein R1sor_025115 [Riccia sorocarpa]|uniref:Trimethylguanosine synthase n=1 Tax=Riccia sorocarpa TaxID=122646 RepID=A0ABD3G7N2_9MARC